MARNGRSQNSREELDDAYRAGARSAEAATAREVDLGALFGIILRQWLTVALCLAVALGLAVAYLLVTPQTFRATSRVLLDPREKTIVGRTDSQPVAGADSVWVDTQASVATSASTLKAVIETQKLVEDGEYGSTADDVLRNFATAVKVERADETYVLDINVDSRSAEKASRLSSALAEAFVDGLVDAKSAEARQANGLLAKQIDDLRAKVRDAEERLETYKRENGIVAAVGTPVSEDSLQQLNTAYIDAKAKADAARERRDLIAKILKDGGGDFSSALDSVNSAVVSRLKIEYAMAAREAAEAADQYGPSHPRMVAARTNAEKYRTLIIDELRATARTAAVDYDLAEANARNAKKALDAATAVVNDNGDASIALRELENEAKAQREIYKGFVSRMAETGLQENTQVSDARVIVPAPVPTKAFAPKKTLVLGLAGLLGLGIGLSAALYRGRDELLALDGDAPSVPVPSAPAKPRRERKSAAEPVVAEKPPRKKKPVPAADPEGETPVRIPLLRRLFKVPGKAFSRKPARPKVPPPPVLAELSVDLREAVPGRTGRLVPRSLRDRIASSVEASPGIPDRGNIDPLISVVEDLEEAAYDLPRTLVFGRADPHHIAAAAYALAVAAARDGRSVLVVDIDESPLQMVAAIAMGRRPGLTEMLTEGADVKAVLYTDPGYRVTFASARRGNGPVPNLYASEVAELFGVVAEAFDHVIIHAGKSLESLLARALLKETDNVVLVVDRAAEADPVQAEAVLDIAATMPGLAGLIMTDVRRIPKRAKPTKLRRVA